MFPWDSFLSSWTLYVPPTSFSWGLPNLTNPPLVAHDDCIPGFFFFFFFLWGVHLWLTDPRELPHSLGVQAHLKAAAPSQLPSNSSGCQGGPDRGCIPSVLICSQCVEETGLGRNRLRLQVLVIFLEVRPAPVFSNPGGRNPTSQQPEWLPWGPCLDESLEAAHPYL